jgi:two-component system, chemotaxis family, chemotaxis protein CheY
MHALVVDDSKVMRRVVGRIVSTLGFDVLEAGNGREALDQVTAHGDAIWVALVDWNMPEMDGLEFVRHVRAMPGNEDLLVMMVTAQNGAEEMRAALDAGADEYLMKPFNEEHLRAKLALLGVEAA